MSHSRIYGFIHNMATLYGIDILRSQLDRLESSGLHKATQWVYCGIVGASPGKGIVLPPRTTITSSPDVLAYEGYTLNKLWQVAKRMNDSDLIWYIHSKGASASDLDELNRATYWRHAMEAVIMDKWSYCADAMSSSLANGSTLFDAYGAHYFPPSDSEQRKFIPGNFWWTTAGFIKSLPSPSEWLIKSETIRTERERFAYETWIGHSRPDINLGGWSEWNDLRGQ